jgi:fatty acid desaturase
LDAHGPAALRCEAMADLQKRGGYTPRKTREQRAFRLVVAGTATGGLGALGAVLAIAGVVGWGGPIILILIALACFGMFKSATS